MARSSWKGNVFVSDFVHALCVTASEKQYSVKRFKLLSNNMPLTTSNQEELKIYRRNHVLSPSQTAFITALLPISLYNGYDFLSVRAIPVAPNLGPDDRSSTPNLASLIATRELEVSHKVKLSKAARKNKAKLVKKKSLTLNKMGNNTRSAPASMNKKVITKKIRK